MEARPLRKLRLDRGWTLEDVARRLVEIDEACRIASQALIIAGETLCDRTVLRVRMLRVQLKPWASAPAVRDLDDQLAAAATWLASGAPSSYQ